MCELTSLITVLCLQLYTEDGGSIEVTQQPTETQRHVSTPAKKRRVMSGWSALLDTIISKASTLQLTPWSVHFIYLFALRLPFR